MIKIKKLSLKNIRSYKSQEIEFPDGSILLSGDIGSGKTTILLALEYAFFGLQPGQRGTALLANGSDIGEIVLEAEINGSNIIIERRLKRSSKTVGQDYSAITIDGDKQELSVTEIKSKILSLLNYPEEFVKKTNLLYRYTVYSPQEEMKQIITESAEDRLNILRHVFGVDKYKKIKENLSLITLRLREKSKEIQAEIKDVDEVKSNIERYQLKIIDLSKKSDLLKAEITLKVSEKKILEDKVKELESKIKEKESFEKEVEKTAILLKTKEDSISNINTEIREITKTLSENLSDFNEKHLEDVILLISTKKEIIDSLNKEQINLSGEISSIKGRIQEDLSKKERIFKIDLCPTCLQNVSENHKHIILNETESRLSAFNNRIKSLDLDLQKNLSSIDSERKYLDDLERSRRELEVLKVKSKQIDIYKQKVLSLETLKANAEKDIKFLESHMSSLKANILDFSKFDNLYRINKEELNKLSLEERKMEIETAEIRREEQITLSLIEDLKTKLEKKEALRDKAGKIIRLENWLSNDFSTLVSHTERNIMIKLREEFSKSFGKWFTLLTTDSFTAQLDENFTPIIMQGGFELDYSYLSGGERTAVALSYRLALNQIINSVFSNINTKGLVILDEPTDGFSEQQLDKVRDILQEIKSDQLILVSHEQKIEGFVDNIIRIKKEPEGSRVIESLS